MELVVDWDAYTWVRAPDAEATDEEIAAWLALATDTYAQVWDPEPGPRLDERRAELRDYLRALFALFAQWETPGQLRFFRMRHVGDDIVPMGLEVYTPEMYAEANTVLGRDATAEEWMAAQREPDPDAAVVGETSLTPVPGAPGWERLFYSVLDESGAVVSFVRYLRHVRDPDVFLVLRGGGGSPGTAVGLLADADALVASIDVLPAAATR